MSLNGKTALVTGASRGIGRAIALRLAEDGANVAVIYAGSADKAEAVVNEITALGVNAKAYRCNVADSAAVNETVKAVTNDLGKIDILVNNAGINIPRLLVDEGHQYELDEAVWDKVMNVNLKGLFFCAQSAARVLVRQRHGVIVNMSSESGLEGSEGQSVYAASKNAVNSLTRSWAKELGKTGVRVVGVAPGILEATGLRTLSYETALAYTRGITVEQLRAGYAKTSTTPMGRSGKLSEVANVVAFMLSGRAGYVDGVTLNIVGGKTRG